MEKPLHTGKLITYFRLEKPCCMKSLVIGFIFIILFNTIPAESKAQLKFVAEKEIPSFIYDEIPVNVIVEGYKNFDIDVIYTTNNLLYVNIEELFRTLQIPCFTTRNGDSLGGFIGSESNQYSIDNSEGIVKVGSRIFNSTNDLVKEMGSLYLESSLLAEAFGIKLTFNFRSLSIILKSDFELPAVKQMRIEKMRSNMAKLKGEEIADTVLSRNYHVFKFGTLDYSITANQIWRGTANNRFYAGIGAELLYGEADVSINYYDRQKFDNRQLLYLWRWVDNDKTIIRQAQVGKISTQSIAFLNSQVVGAVVRNTPTIVRKAKGYYTINEFTEPNWTVELYINNVLVDYTKADASGSFRFKVPIVYGFTTLKLKYYGPQGEERSEERTMNVPYTVMPANEFEYGITAGIVQDSSHSRFGKADFNYGVSRLLTVGGGLEYLSSITTGPYIPFVKASLQPFTNLTLNAEYAYGVRTRALLNYNFGKSAVLEIDYSNYVDGQRATIFNADEERRIRLSLPFRYKKINGFFKLDYSQFVYSEFFFNQGSAMVSMYSNQISANSSMQLNWVGQKSPFIINETSLSYRMRNGFTLRPSARYNVSENSMMSCKAEIDKRISKAYLSVSYEQYFANNDHYVNLTIRYDLPFARASVSFAQSKGKVMTSESAQGSLAFGGDKYTHVSNNSSVSKGGIVLYPFLDLNQNGIFDKAEPKVKINTVKISGGRALFNEKDSIVRIPELNSFTEYFLTFDDNDLENIAWRFKNAKYQVLVDPNQFKRIDIPVITVGEINGMTYLDKGNYVKGIGRIWIKIYDKKSGKLVAETLSESDGYIYYLGLAPGDYFACVDSVQLNNLGFNADPPCREFFIKPSEDGDIVDGLNFILKSEQIETKDKQPVISESKTVNPADDSIIVAQQPDIVPSVDSSKINVNDLPEINKPPALPLLLNQAYVAYDTISYPAGTYFKVQLLALLSPIKIAGYFGLLQNRIPGLKIVETIEPDGFYHYSTGIFGSYAEAKKYERLIRNSGWIDCFISVYTSGVRD